MGSPPFSATRIDLGLAELSPLKPGEAAPLAKAVAAIDPWRRMAYPVEALTGFLTREDAALRRYAIRRDGAVAGAVAVRHPWLKGPYLEFLALLPAAQGQGIGRHVLEWMEREAGSDSRNLWVLASDFNSRALAFYERHGFSRVTPLPGLAVDGFTEILLRKRLR